jgi:hypothetical protein
MMEGEKIESHQKGFLKLKCLSPLKMLASLFFEETFGAFFPLFLSSSLEDLWDLMIFEKKITSSKLLFKWLQYSGGGRIFQSGVMHANMSKPWLGRWGSCGYIGGGRIFWSGCMHANIYG